MRRLMFVAASIQFALAVMATVGLQYAVDASPRPFISEDVPGRESCVPGDPAYPCRGRRVKVENRGSRPVNVELFCDDDNLINNIKGRVGAHGATIFDITTTRPGGLLEGECKIVYWSADGKK